jgi:hypothetical protein
MAAQSELHRLGIRFATLGSLASLAIAAPLSEGDVSNTAHTDASRIGICFSRDVGEEGMSFVANGSRRLTVSVNGVTTDAPGAVKQNEFFGYKAGNITTTGNGGNTALGWSALNAVTTGEYNTSLGRRSGLSLTTGYSNIFIGSSAGRAITTGNSNVVIGNAGMTGTTNAVGNVMIGAAGVGFTAADPKYNVFLGWGAAANASTIDLVDKLLIALLQ